MSPGDESSPTNHDLFRAVRLANANWIALEYGHRMRFIVSADPVNGDGGAFCLGIFDAMTDTFITLEELLEHLPVEQRKLDLGC